MSGGDTAQVLGAALRSVTPPANQLDWVNGLTNATAGAHVINDNLSYYGLHIQYDPKVATLMSASSFGEINERHRSHFTDLNLAPGFTQMHDARNAAAPATSLVLSLAAKVATSEAF